MKLLLVDGHYYLYRSFFAVRELKTSRGEPTNAIFGFAKALRKMLADVRPDRAAVVWDAGVPERRSALCPGYKQHRPPMPDDLRPQERWLRENVPLFGVASLSVPHTEADDLIASYAADAARVGNDVVIATNDKDILQIVSDSVQIYSTVKNAPGAPSFALLGVPEVREKWGVEPRKIADVLAFTGDTSDNIPGVPGIGDKTARALVSAHGTVAEILQNIESVSNPRIREKIALHRDQIVSNREMVRLDEDLALPGDWRTFEIHQRTNELLEAFRHFEFRALVAEIERELAPPPTSAQGELF